MFEETEEQENEPRRKPQGRQRSFVKEVREGVKREKSAAQRAQKTVKTMMAVGKVANPLTLGILGVVVLVGVTLFILLLTFTGCSSVGGWYKASDESGGSLFSGLSFDNPEHRGLVEEVVQCAQGEDPVLISDYPGFVEELDWVEDENGNKHHELDYRIISTLSYLCKTWSERGQGKIGVNLTYGNGPSLTRTGVRGNTGEFELSDAYSAYQYGQAIGIDIIGLTGPELTRALGLREPIPVRVDWQKTTSEKSIRPLYEQMGVHASLLYEVMTGVFGQVRTNEPDEEFWRALAGAHQAVVGYGEKDAFTLTLERGRMLVDNLNELSGVGGLDKRTVELAGLALKHLGTRLNILVGLEQSDGVAFMKEVAKEETEEDFRKGIQYSFRAMQVANMVGWYGNTEKINLWKAYEARQNIRQLVLDLLRMPIEMAEEDNGGDAFNSLLVVNQLIIYSPEDDLDNNLPDLDVYPDGTVAVNEGGVAFGGTPDGKLTLPDKHFTALPVDNGPFSKACTTFVYKVKEDDQEKIGSIKNLLSSLAPSGPIEQMCNLLYGPVEAPIEKSTAKEEETTPQADGSEELVEPKEIEVVGRVTYQKFVHIAF